jgi:hypothetical protein
MKDTSRAGYFTYKTCVGSTSEDLDVQVQECLDAGYNLNGSPVISSVVDKDGNLMSIYSQAVLKQNV